MISADARLNALLADITGALISDDLRKFLTSLDTAAQIGRAYQSNLEKPQPIEFTEPPTMIPFPDAMGLRGVSFASHEPVLFVGFPGDGKTTFCTNLIAHQIMAKRRVVLMHNEGDTQEYAAGIYRIVWSIVPGISARRISLDEVFSPEEKSKAQKWVDSSPNLSIVDIAKSSPQDVVARMTQLYSKNQADIILFDYLQNVTVSDPNKRFVAWSWLALQIESICKTWRKPIIVFAQMNREGGREALPDKAPSLGVTEGCPLIEQKAGVVVNLRNGSKNIRDWDKAPFFWVNVAKNRRGPGGQRSTKLDTQSGALVGQMMPDEFERVHEMINAQRKRK